jgi:hypothetical protein
VDVDDGDGDGDDAPLQVTDCMEAVLSKPHVTNEIMVARSEGYRTEGRWYRQQADEIRLRAVDLFAALNPPAPD